MAAAVEGESDEPSSETENGRQGRIGMRPDIGSEQENGNRPLIADSRPDIELRTEDEVSDRETENAKKKRKYQYETTLRDDTRYSGNTPVELTSEGPANNDQGSPHYEEVFYRNNENLYTPVIPSGGELQPRTFSFKSTGGSRSRLSESGRFADPRVPETPGYVTQAECEYIPLTELKGPTPPLVHNPVQSPHEYPREPNHPFPVKQVGRDKEKDDANPLDKKSTSSDSRNVDNPKDVVEPIKIGEEENRSSAKCLNRQAQVETGSLHSDRTQLEMNAGDQNDHRNEDVENGNEDSNHGNEDVENRNENTENANEDIEHGKEDSKQTNEDSEHGNEDIENRNAGDIEHGNEDSKHEIKDLKHAENEDSEHGNKNQDEVQSPKSPIHGGNSSQSLSDSSGGNPMTSPAAALSD